MMNSPEEYRKGNESKSIEELVLERIKLFNEIVEYEQKHIINNDLKPDYVHRTISGS